MTNHFFAKSLAVENFKAIRKGSSVQLTPLTVFIGNNGSGKSSLIEGLDTYRSIVLDGLDSAMNRWRGMEYVWNQAASHGRKTVPDGHIIHENTFTIHLKGIWGRGRFKVRLMACPESGGNRIRIEDEFIELPGARLLRRDWTGRCESYGDGGAVMASAPPLDGSGVRVAKSRDRVLDRVMMYLPGESASPLDWKEIVRRWQFLALEPRPMGDPERQRMTDGPPLLNRDGSNLGQYLLSMREASVDAFNDLLEALQFVLPFVRDLRPVLTHAIERCVSLETIEEGYMVPGWLLSTGTLRVLALLACLRHPDPPPLLVVEEIENGLDPRTIHLLVEEIRAAISAKTTQVLCTTHSPYLLDLLDLSHIVVVELDEGRVTFQRPDAERLREWSKSFSAGQLYTMGHLTRKS
jgi:predicted ATPase